MSTVVRPPGPHRIAVTRPGDGLTAGSSPLEALLPSSGAFVPAPAPAPHRALALERAPVAPRFARCRSTPCGLARRVVRPRGGARSLPPGAAPKPAEPDGIIRPRGVPDAGHRSVAAQTPGADPRRLCDPLARTRQRGEPAGVDQPHRQRGLLNGRASVAAATAQLDLWFIRSMISAASSAASIVSSSARWGSSPLSPSRARSAEQSSTACSAMIEARRRASSVGRATS